jgi:hypothetical protein
MQRNFPKVRAHLLAAVAGAVLMSACSFGDDGDAVDPNAPPPVVAIPDSALVSASAYAEYAKTLANSDTDAPVDISKVNTPPTSETGEPIAL